MRNSSSSKKAKNKFTKFIYGLFTNNIAIKVLAISLGFLFWLFI